jgi:hypothetical protein
VKNVLFPHKNNVEQGRAFIDSVRDVHASHIGYDLDPEHEQMQGNDEETAMEVDVLLVKKLQWRYYLWSTPGASVLGPILFLLYINDFYNCSKILDFHLFADDSNIFYTDKKLSKV